MPSGYESNATETNDSIEIPTTVSVSPSYRSPLAEQNQPVEKIDSQKHGRVQPNTSPPFTFGVLPHLILQISFQLLEELQQVWKFELSKGLMLVYLFLIFQRKLEIKLDRISKRETYRLLAFPS